MQRVPLRNRYDEVVAYALVDSGDDYEAVSAHRWHLNNGYAERAVRRAGGGYTTEQMQVFLMGRRPGYEVDHSNRERLDNRRSNLRWVTKDEQQDNRGSLGGTSRFKGVHWHRASQKWIAGTSFRGRYYYAQLHETEEDAARAYDDLVVRLRGPGAVTNRKLGLL